MSIVSIRNILVGWSDRINAAASAASGQVVSLPSTNRLASALQAAINALDSLRQAEEQTALILSDPDLSGNARLSRADALRSQATQTATDALDALQQVADDLHDSITSSWIPKKRPASATDVMVVYRCQQLERVLGAEAGDGPHLIEAAGKLLKDALTAGDDDGALTVYCLTSQLDLFYRSVGVTPTMRDAQFGAAVGNKVGGNLAPLLGSGAGTLSGFISTARSEITSTLAAMKQTADQWAVALAGQGMVKPGGSQWDQPASVDPSARYLRGR